MQKQNLPKYNIVVLLCASSLNRGYFDEFSKDGSYLGGQTRMQAAVDISPRVKTFILVGGGADETEESKKWKKTQDMEKFLKENKVKSTLIKIVSTSDTLGNFRGIYKCFVDVGLLGSGKKERDEKEIIEIGVLTNFYHLPRAMRFAWDTFKRTKVRFYPIVAESVIKKQPPTYLEHIPAFISVIFNDIKGLKDWEEGNYRKQILNKEKWNEEQKKIKCSRKDMKQLQKILNYKVLN